MGEWFIGPNENLQDVFDLAPAGMTIRLKSGIYRQKVCIRTPDLKIFGEGISRTVIVNSDCAKKLDSVNRPYNTFRTYTVAIAASGISIHNLTIQNDAGYPEKNGQQIALTVYGDCFRMNNCALISTQDTLFLGPLPSDLIVRYHDLLPSFLRTPEKLTSVFESSFIEGTVDFVFGGGDATFSSCEIHSVSQIGSFGYVAAPSHSQNDQSGFSFTKCRFTSDPSVKKHSVFLARPWRDYGKAVFLNCSYGEHIHPLGFDKWGTTDRDKTARFYETPPQPGRVLWTKRFD